MPRTTTPPAETKRGRGRPRTARPTRPRAAAENLTDAELLARAISLTTTVDTPDGSRRPITDAEFARDVLKCHPRTLRKYINGRALPALAREKLLDHVHWAKIREPR